MIRTGFFLGILFLLILQLRAQNVGLGFGVATEYDYRESTYQDAIRYGAYVETEEFERFIRPVLSYYHFIRSRELFQLESGRLGGSYDSYLVVDTTGQEYRKALEGTTHSIFNASFRAGYGLRIKEKKNVSTYVSLCVNPQYRREVNEPKLLGFKTAVTKLGADFELMTNTFILLNDHVRLNIALPIKIWNYSMVWNRIDNPAIPINQQRNSQSDNRFFPLGIELKMGLVYMLSKD